MSRARRHVGVLVTVAVAAALVGACGGADDPAGAPEPSATSPASTSASTTTAPPGSPGADASDAAAYLPVPVGVELTPQGTELALDESAVVAWEPRQELVGVLDVTVTELRRTSFAESFRGWQLDAATRRSTPYFVRARVTNVGATDVGGRGVPLYAVDATDRLIQPSGFQTRFDPCPGSGVFPKTFAPGDAKDLCLVYLVPGGGELTAVSFRPRQDFDPITWTGRIRTPGQQNRR